MWDERERNAELGLQTHEHHPGRCPGETEPLDEITHSFIHQDERDAAELMGGNRGSWTAKRIEEGG